MSTSPYAHMPQNTVSTPDDPRFPSPRARARARARAIAIAATVTSQPETLASGIAVPPITEACMRPQPQTESLPCKEI
ncbi:hypothetical protein N7475_001890 [Penicillium sp. IBT 31633x]|nr:hypothetical protein N7475_001890 [Penicillium sp. IBT 31633x]